MNRFHVACRSCRQSLFFDSHVKHHEAGCAAFFIEPMKWMQDTGRTEGRLLCPNARCQAKLGHFSWHGEKCDCGAWNNPAFQVHRSKVDKLPLECSNDKAIGVRGIIPEDLFDELLGQADNHGKNSTA
eukprot:Polyplicarium_translucidae@DN3187_c0_g1_i10.p3